MIKFLLEKNHFLTNRILNAVIKVKGEVRVSCLSLEHVSISLRARDSNASMQEWYCRRIVRACQYFNNRGFSTSTRSFPFAPIAFLPFTLLAV